MNKSYSKIRHIQESNQILEKRILADKKVRVGLYEQNVVIKEPTKKEVSKLEDLIGMNILFKPKEIDGLTKKGDNKFDDFYDFTKSSEQIDSKDKSQIMGYNISDKIKTIEPLSNDLIRIYLEKYQGIIYFKCGDEVFKTLIPSGTFFGPMRDFNVKMTYTCPKASEIINKLIPCGGYDLSSSGVDLSAISTLS